MCKKHSFSLLLFLFAMFSTIHISAQKTRGDLHFKDGTVKSGFVKIIGIRDVKFKNKKKEKATMYQMVEMEKVVIHEFESSATYVLRQTDKGNYRVLKVLELGRVNLYTKEVQGYSAPMMTGGQNMGMTMGYSYNITNLFVQREGEVLVTHLGTSGTFSKNFRKAASKYFSDCPSLTEKIENKEYKKRDIRVIVNFYNEECILPESE
ncbi:MAG: hypothetical protein AB8B59_14955 [Maribacter sp.]